MCTGCTLPYPSVVVVRSETVETAAGRLNGMDVFDTVVGSVATVVLLVVSLEVVLRILNTCEASLSMA